MRDLAPFALPLFSGGEQSAAAPGIYQPDEVAELENALVSGRGVVEQRPDWILADTCKNLAGTPLENHAVCGIFPFSTAGGLGTDSGGVAFSFNTTDNKIYLHHLNIDGAIQRTLEAYASYTEALPPVMTGFEYFGKFIFCADGFEAAANRLGLGIYDPASTGTVTIPTIEVVSGTAVAARLRFKGISLHQGGSPLGWGYRSEETGSIDRPDILRSAGYTTADLSLDAAWQTTPLPTDDRRPFEVVVGTPGLPIIGCCDAGNYTVVGKESEVFVLEGAYAALFRLDRVAVGHGPAGTAGMASIGSGACWMSNAGPVAMLGGGLPRLIGTDRLTERFRTYFDLQRSVACHYPDLNWVLWMLRRQRTFEGAALATNQADELLVWDYERNVFMIQSTPGTVGAVGIVKGTGIVLTGPAGAPTSPGTTLLTSSSVTATWTNGDTTSGVETVVRYKPDSSSTWIPLPGVGPHVIGRPITGLSPSTLYDFDVYHVKNGIESAHVAAQFTTAAGSSVSAPTSFSAAHQASEVIKGTTHHTYHFSWTRTEFTVGATTRIYRGTGASQGDSAVIETLGASTTSYDEQQSSGEVFYYWVAHVAGGIESAVTALSGNPLTYDFA